MPPKRKSVLISSASSGSGAGSSSKSAKNDDSDTVNSYLSPDQAKKMSEWQENLETVAARDWHMFTQEMYTDCTFSIGENFTQVKCHRIYLAKNSPYFSAMFYGDMRKKTDEVICLSDVNLEAFKAMLKYMYLGRLMLHSYSYYVVCQLLHLSKMFLLPKIFRRQIRNHLWEHIFPHNLWTAIEFGSSNDEITLERTAWQLVEIQTKAALKLPSLKDIPSSTLLSLVKRDSLNCSEFELFTACMHWAREEISGQGLTHDTLTIRNILSEVIPHIRFLAMKKEEYISFIELFTAEENQPILVFHINGSIGKLSPIFCSKTACRSEAKHKHFEVLGHPSVEDNKKSKLIVGEKFASYTTSTVLAGGFI